MNEHGMRFLRAALAAAIAVGVLWLVYLLVWILPLDPGDLGIVPRTVAGLKGILLSPLVHANPAHLAANSAPLAVLLALSLFTDIRRTIMAVIVIMVLGGALVWLLGGSGSHLGASGLVYGLTGYLGLAGFFRGRFWDMVVSVLVLVLFSALLGSLFSNQPGVSWSAHIYGLVGGVAAAWLLNRNARKERESDRGEEEAV